MNLLRSIGKKKDAVGDLSGRLLTIDGRTVKVETIVGEGGFATIYRVADAATRELMALKHFRLGGNEELVSSVYREIGIMDELKECPQTLSLIAAEFGPDNNEAFVLMEYCQGNLASYLHQQGKPLELEVALSIFWEICLGVRALHSLDPPCAHRDIKAENVLLHADGRWLLCDFGSTSSKQQTYTASGDIALMEEEVRKNTTPAYRAPEMWDLFSRDFIGLKVDIWALGCLCFFLCFGRLPFDGDAKLQILNGQYSIPEHAPGSLKRLLRGMLTVDVGRRWDINLVLQQIGAMDGLEDSIPSPIQEEPPARPPPVESRASRQAPRSTAAVPGPLASAARVAAPAAAAPALAPAVATPPATLSAPTTAPRAARAAAAAPGRAAIALAPPPPPATPAWESDFSATPATSQVSSSGWATFGQFEDGNAASLSVAEAADFALPLEASEPSAVSSDAEGLLGAFQSLGPTPATPPETPLSSAATDQPTVTRQPSRLPETVAPKDAQLERLQARCDALEAKLGDKEEEVRSLREELAQKLRQIEVLQQQLSQASLPPETTVSISKQLSGMGPALRGLESSFHVERTGPSSSGSSPTKAAGHRRSFTAGSAISMASPMRSTSSTTSRPASAQWNRRDNGQPTCFEQLNPLG